jgi:hypothetical protein
MKRGRPSEEIQPLLTKWTQTCYEVPSKPELGGKTIWHFDKSKSENGPILVENIPATGFKSPIVKPSKNKSYGNQVVVIVFKPSNRKNAKLKMKVWQNQNIDYIMSLDKLVGIPETAEILELGVGENLVKRYKTKYNL